MARTRIRSGADPYKPVQTGELELIELKRRHLGVTVAELAERIGMSERQMTNIRRSKRAWPRNIRAMKMALRSIERERRGEGELMAAPARGGEGQA